MSNGNAKGRMRSKPIRMGNGTDIEASALWCCNCGRFLLDYTIVWGVMNVPCPKCKSVTTVEIVPPDDSREEVEAVASTDGDGAS